jgi:DNA-binding MarR family transcriptional regulator
MTLDNDRTAPTPPARQSPETHLHIVRRLRRAFLSICRCGDVRFSPYRLTTDQYALMRAVQRQQGIRQADLGNVIFAEPNTVTAMVSLLERRGILRRKLSPADGRARLLYLTTHGQNVMQRLSEDWDPMRKLLIDCFAGESGQKTLEVLDRVYEEMEREREKLIRSAEPADEQDLAPFVQELNKPADIRSTAKPTNIRSSKRSALALMKDKVQKPANKTARPQKRSLTN